MTNASSPVSTSVLIVTWNSAATIADCVGPLVNHVGIEIVVADNASSDDTVELVRAESSAAIIVETGANCGFAAGINAAARAASGDVLVLLNPDAVTDPGTVRSLAEAVRTDPRGGIAAPALVDEHGVRTRSTRRMLRVSDQWVVALGLHRISSRLDPDKETLTGADSGPIPVQVVSGACFATPTELFDRLGGLDTRFFLYSEEVDYCVRVAAEDGRVDLHPELVVRHIGGVSAALAPSATDVALRESRVRLFQKHRGSAAARLVQAGMLTGAVVRLLPSVVVDAARPTRPRWRRTRGQWAIMRALGRPTSRVLEPSHPVPAEFAHRDGPQPR